MSNQQETNNQGKICKSIVNIETMLGHVHYFYKTVHCNTTILIQLNFPYFDLYSAFVSVLYTCSCMVFLMKFLLV